MAFPAEPDGTFQRWITEHHAMLGKIARAYASSPAAILELENEMLYQVWRSVPSFTGEAKESTWIYRVCLNTAMTWRRDTSRRDQRFDASSDTQAIAANEKSPADTASDRDLLDRLYAAVHSLPKFDRGLVLLSLDGLTYRQMADVSGLSENRIGVILTRARKRLAQHLKGVADEME